jgi:hypothetical protein
MALLHTLLMDENVITLSRTAPIAFSYSGMVSCTNNHSAQGTLIKADGPVPFVSTDHLVESYLPTAEDAILLAL